MSNELHDADLLARGHGEGQASALRELGIDVSEIEWARGVIAATRHLPPDAAALVEGAEARAAKATPGPWDTSALDQVSWWTVDDRTFVAHAIDDIPALVALVRAQRVEMARITHERDKIQAHWEQMAGAAGMANELSAALAKEIAALREAHASEREGLLGDKAHLKEELDAAVELVIGLRRQWDHWEPLLRAYHAGVDRNRLMAACVERWGPSTSVGASDLRGLAEREANQ